MVDLMSIRPDRWIYVASLLFLLIWGFVLMSVVWWQPMVVLINEREYPVSRMDLNIYFMIYRNTLLLISKRLKKHLIVWP